MAYSAVIDIRVNGEGKINNVTKQIQKLNQINRSLKPVPDLFQRARGGTEETRKKINDLKTTLSNTLKKFGEVGKVTGFSKTIGGLNSQLSAFRQVANSAKIGSDEFNRSLIAGQNASRELLRAELARIKTLQTLYQTDGGMKFTPKTRKQQLTGLLDIGKDLPQTTSALRTYKSELEAAISVVEIGSKEFLQLSTAIESINQSLKKADILRGRGPKQKDDSNRIKSIREQTLNIERRITDSTINKAAKNKLLNQLGTTNNAIKNKELDLARQINIETQRNLTMQEKMQRRRGRIAQSTLIGGGFPLLFGGGPLQAVAGAIGGGLGETFSPGGGFAGSIAATAAISSVQKFANSAREVGNALKDANLGLDKLKDLGFEVDESTRKQVESLLEAGKVRQAEAIVAQKFADIIGPKAVKNLMDLDTSFDELQKQTSELFLILSSELAPALTVILDLVSGIVKAVPGPKIQRAAANLNPQAFQEAQEKARLGSTGFIQGDRKLYNEILTELSKNIIKEFTPDLTTNKPSSSSSRTQQDLSQYELRVLNERIALQKLSGGLLNDEVVETKKKIIQAQTHLKIMQAEGDMGKIAVIQAERLLEVNKLNSEVNLARGKDFAEKVIKPQMELLDKQEQAEFDAGAAIGKRLAPEIEMFNTLDQEVKSMELINKLQDAETVEQRVQIQLKLAELKLGYEISDLNRKDIEDLIRKKEQQLENNKAVAQEKALRQEIEGILAGGMTNAVMGLIEGSKTLGQVLADVARQLASMFLNRAFMSIFSSFGGGGGIGGGALPPAPIYVAAQGGFSRSGGFKAFQSGGVVNSPTMGMVGEGGESEYIIPASKMSGAMARYSAGARGGAVIPGGSGDSGTVAGGTGNTVVEYTGPTLNFNGDEYVPKSAVPEIIGAATKQGAMAGKAQVLGTLRNSRSQRASLGL